MATNTKRVPLSGTENVVLGAAGGIVETCIQMPLITYKICVQEGRALPKNFGGWYRGVFANAASLAPITALQMFANGVLEKTITGGQRPPSELEQIATAMGAGSISALIYSPVDLLVIQQQKLKLPPMPAISHIVKHYGPLGMYRGFNACVVREAIYTAGYLGLAPVAVGRLNKMAPWFEENPSTTRLIGACIGGTVAAMLTHPMDTAKTCLQADIGKEVYQNTRTAIPKIYEQGGIGMLYQGGLARTARLCGAFFIINSVRELAMDMKAKWASE
eukprot:1180407-Prorocentrum_minimum.AAC.1